MHRATAVFAALLFATGPSLAAQTTIASSVGHRVRLKTDSASEWLQGTLVAADGDSLHLRTDVNYQLVAIARGAVSQLEVAHGTHGNAGTGALIGLGIGAVAGGVWGASQPGCAAQTWCFDPGPAADAAGGALLVGAAGALVGAIIGSASPSDQWEPVSIE